MPVEGSLHFELLLLRRPDLVAEPSKGSPQIGFGIGFLKLLRLIGRDNPEPFVARRIDGRIIEANCPGKWTATLPARLLTNKLLLRLGGVKLTVCAKACTVGHEF
jgi:hypothetical protein